LIRSNWSL